MPERTKFAIEYASRGQATGAIIVDVKAKGGCSPSLGLLVAEDS